MEAPDEVGRALTRSEKGRIVRMWKFTKNIFVVVF